MITLRTRSRDVTTNTTPTQAPAIYSPNLRIILSLCQQQQQQQQQHLLSQDVTDNIPSNEFYDPRTKVMNENLCRESERLRTFSFDWPIDFIDKNLLSQTGMFYTGEDDTVKCYFCAVEIGRWEPSDNVLSEHMRWSPNCPLIRRRSTNNVPTDIELLDSILPPISYDVCGANDIIEVRPAAYAEGSIAVQQNNQQQINSLSSTPSSISSNESTNFSIPKHSEYAILSARMRSFNGWPKQMKQKPAQLSEAGFFYVGTKDCVKCFSCGGGLTDWEETDDPWEQHALWLENCRYLKLMKGTSFIDRIKEKFNKNENESTSNKCNDTKDVEKSLSSIEINNLNEMASLDDKLLCKICYECQNDTAFIPCGHVACANCASSVTKCPLCRTVFKDLMRVHL